ncbi:uncharacterized protein LOC131687019 [Topomyia yanbarensis]|uniref:uncharacterized protein LOC131687019 n=1 Tax=Topomyia yanbarensis TaxID=2498891 RepID=UPI00273C73BA|nr:uncharacterized protein LOC131687019 [Topomyia yanbarensis]
MGHESIVMALSVFIVALIFGSVFASRVSRYDQLERVDAPVVQFGTWRANDAVCYHRKIFRWSSSPQIIMFHNPTGAAINYIIVESKQNGLGGLRVDLVEGAVGTSDVRLEIHGTPEWVPYFLHDVVIEMKCVAAAGRIRLDELYALALMPGFTPFRNRTIQSYL